ncbi:MAG: TetR/AcrR family transcriptional regulator [Clostridiales bacterium]|nr:TetR/AcrR family transcriptional regulator [Clostridiales bacterium]
MEKDKYHHGNLKNALIEKAIELVNNVGEDSLSIRKVAGACGVTYAAPYAHFKSKEELLLACREYVSQQFANRLTNAIAGMDTTRPETLNVLGNAYIAFFKQHPAYYDFIFNTKEACKMVLTLDEVTGNYPPFEVFRKVCLALTEAYGIPKEEGLARLIRCWSLVHGATALIISPNVRLDGDWDEYLKTLYR